MPKNDVTVILTWVIAILALILALCSLLGNLCLT